MGREDHAATVCRNRRIWTMHGRRVLDVGAVRFRLPGVGGCETTEPEVVAYFLDIALDSPLTQEVSDLFVRV